MTPPFPAPGLFVQLRVLFDREDSVRAAGLLILMVIGAALEMIAVGMMFPLVEALSKSSGEPTMPLAAILYQWLAPSSHARFVFWLLALLVAFYVIKNLFYVLLFYLQNRFGFHVQGKLSYRLFAHYLHLPYNFHLQRNTVDLLRNLTHETDQIVWAAVIPGLTLVTESLVALGLVALLFYSSFQAALVISTLFGVTGFLYYRFFRYSLERWGKARIHHDALRMRSIREGLGGLKELKVLGRSSFFLDAYDRHNQQRAHFSARYNMVLNSNLLLLEVLGVSSLLILVGLHLAEGKAFETILPMMGVFAGAAFRLIPATNRIINNLQQFQYAAPVVRNLYSELAQAGGGLPPIADSGGPLEFRREISLDGLSFRYAPDRPEVLREVTMCIERGETVGLIGTSGTGKTTLVDLLLGILQPDAGSIRVDNRDIGECLDAWQRMIGYVPQSIYLVDGTIRQNVALAIPDDQIDDSRVLAALAEAQLADFVASLPAGIHTPVGELGKRMSGGQRQRIGIARALYHNPQVLVLDEATSSLDMVTENAIINTIRGMHRHKTILIITHRMSALRSCDRVFRLDQGHITRQAID